MASKHRPITAGISRRHILRGAGLALGGGAAIGLAMAPPTASAATKMSQKSALYQDKPQGQARCNVCTQWQPPAACRVIDGAISPTGWCQLFVAKY